MLVKSSELLQKAKEKKCAIPAPDFVDYDTMQWFIEVADQEELPLLLSFGEPLVGLVDFETGTNLAIESAKKSKAPIVLHLDHGASVEICKKAVDLGFSSVMIDASSEAFETNVALTKEVVDYAHAHNVDVEAEIGHVGSNRDSDDGDIYTSVEEAIKFVELTGVDSLAVSIGTSHGLYKGTPKINFERLHELSEAVPVPLVLHGGSSSGDENLERCATEGISKINIFTDFMVAASQAMKDYQPENLDMVTYFEYRLAPKKAVQNLLKKFYTLFHTYQIKGE